jgi:hypothetical protein
MLIRIIKIKTNKRGKDTNEERQNILNLKRDVDFFNFDWNPIRTCDALKILKI